MFKYIWSFIKKLFRFGKSSKITMDEAIAKAEAIKESDKKAEEATVQLKSYTKKDNISKKAKNLATGFRSNAISRNVTSIEPAKRTIRSFGNFRAIKNAWYLPLKSHRKKV